MNSISLPESSATLSERLRTKENGLNALRLLLAFMVLVSHTAPVAGLAQPLTGVGGFGGIAVSGFFIISGYLIAGSRIHSSLGRYLLRRVTRIYPTFWVQLLLVAFVAAPLAMAWGFGDWSVRAAWEYVAKNFITFSSSYLVGSTPQAEYPAWNGSAWTLPFEMLAYLACAVIFSLGWARRHPAVTGAVLFLGASLMHGIGEDRLHITTNFYMNGFRLAAFFSAGILFYGLAHRLRPRRWTALAAMLLGMVVQLLPVVGESRWIVLTAPLLAYGLLGVGATTSIRVGVHNDISYGMYIYAFPVQQFVTMSGVVHATGPWWFLVHLLLSTAGTTALAWGSWLFVERPSIALTGRFLLAQKQRRSPEGPRAAQSV